jgi:hypothetical protein
MRWFRSRSKFGASLALSALVMQLVLSLGHIHRKDVAGHLHLLAVGSLQEQEPADRDSHGHEDQYCAIYAINSLLGCSQTPEPCTLPLPLTVNAARIAGDFQFSLTSSRHLLSQARAPPIT